MENVCMVMLDNHTNIYMLIATHSLHLKKERELEQNLALPRGASDLLKNYGRRCFLSRANDLSPLQKDINALKRCGMTWQLKLCFCQYHRLEGRTSAHRSLLIILRPLPALVAKLTPPFLLLRFKRRDICTIGNIQE
ncbi:hypothetical protein MLD38_004037 [Melastoma candidum]|uniref:Uncharacterized protein n=1 Tax=Melastoma candidum TaxID=119954 RepID=A0ACB9S3X9_9MYRT|nr:hypothetical protein MLD38_004037 [Melastoma candidum]